MVESTEKRHGSIRPPQRGARVWNHQPLEVAAVSLQAGDDASESCCRSTPNCIDGQAEAANKRITDALAPQDAEQNPIDTGDGDSELQPEVAGQRREAGRTVSVTARTAPRPWPFPPSSVACTPPEPGARTHSGRRRPES